MSLPDFSRCPSVYDPRSNHPTSMVKSTRNSPGGRCTHPALRRRDEVHENATEPQPAVSKGCKGWSCGRLSGVVRLRGTFSPIFCGASNNENKTWGCLMSLGCLIQHRQFESGSLYHNIKMANDFLGDPQNPWSKGF